jgi:iron complex transport system substrate-binding protein
VSALIRSVRRGTSSSGPRPASRAGRLLILALVLLLPGCSGCSDGSGQDGEPAASASGQATRTGPDGTVWPILDPAPQAVIPASAGVVDMVCALLPPERVAALPSQALRYSSMRDARSPHLARPTFTVYESERILVHEPDLVMADTWQSADTTQRLREADVSVLVLPEATDWASIRQLILDVATVLGAEPEGARLVGAYDRRVSELQRATEGRERPTAICYSNGGAGGWIAGAGTTNDEALGLAGLRNLAAEGGRRGHVAVSFEELLLLDPDLIVVGGQAAAQEPGGTAALLLSTPALADLRAVRDGRILVIESWLYTTTSQYVVDAAEEIARLAEPYR